MKIAMIGHKDFPSRSGGVEVVVYELSTKLSKKGHDVTVYNRSTCHENNGAETFGVKMKSAPTFKKESLNAMVASFTATFKALFGGYDVIHYHAIGPSVALFVARLFGKKTVATVHGLNWRCAKWGRFATAYLKFGERIIAKFANEVIVLSEDMEQYFLDTYGRKTVFIKNAIEPLEETPCNIIKDKYGLEKNDYVLYLARISREKGLHYLISGYKKSGIKQKLVIAGALPDNDYGNEIKSLAEDRDDIIFTGFVNLDLIKELYSIVLFMFCQAKPRVLR